MFLDTEKFLLVLFKKLLDKLKKRGKNSIKKSGNTIEAYYESDLLNKKLYIFRPIKQNDKLRTIFRKLKIKVPKFEIRNLMLTG